MVHIVMGLIMNEIHVSQDEGFQVSQSNDS